MRIYRIRYLKAIGYFSMSQCTTGPTREIVIGPKRPQVEKNKSAHLLLVHDYCQVTQHPEVRLTQQQLEAEMKSTLGKGGYVPV